MCVCERGGCVEMWDCEGVCALIYRGVVICGGVGSCVANTSLRLSYLSSDVTGDSVTLP